MRPTWKRLAVPSASYTHSRIHSSRPYSWGSSIRSLYSSSGTEMAPYSAKISFQQNPYNKSPDPGKYTEVTRIVGSAKLPNHSPNEMDRRRVSDARTGWLPLWSVYWCRVAWVRDHFQCFGSVNWCGSAIVVGEMLTAILAAAARMCRMCRCSARVESKRMTSVSGAAAAECSTSTSVALCAWEKCHHYIV